MKADNPFYVLEIDPEATPGEIEREGRKVLGLIEIGSENAAKYTFPRDPTRVREAMAELRDPKKRGRYAILAGVLRGAIPTPPARDIDAPLADAFALAGYRGL